MDSGKITKYFFILIIAGLVAFLGYHIYGYYSFMNSLGECGMANGPCYGIKVNVNHRKEIIDLYLDCPNGKIGFIHTQDSAYPEIFKVDEKMNIKWAYRLKTDTCSGIPLLKLSNIRLTKGRRITIDFFNETYGEPGEIILNDDYDFQYVCLGPM